MHSCSADHGMAYVAQYRALLRLCDLMQRHAPDTDSCPNKPLCLAVFVIVSWRNRVNGIPEDRFWSSTVSYRVAAMNS
jgi:hypothetical protein